MKKTLLVSALLSLLASPVLADIAIQPLTMEVAKNILTRQKSARGLSHAKFVIFTLRGECGERGGELVRAWGGEMNPYVYCADHGAKYLCTALCEAPVSP